MGEWVESTRTLVKYACMDTQRRAAVISKHERSLERSWAEMTTRRVAGTPTSTRPSRRSAASRRATRTTPRRSEKRQGFLDWAVPQLSPKRRAVIELDRADVPVEEMQERLDVSRDVVYASRSRAIKDLAKLREGYES